MKIVYIHQYFRFPYESGGTRSYDLAKSFVDKGFKVEIISATSDLKYKNNTTWMVHKEDGLIVNYIYLPYDNQMSYFQRSIVFLKFIYFTTLKLFSLNADLVLATSTPLTIGIPALLNKWYNKVNFVFEARDVWPEAVIAIGVIKNSFMKWILYKLEYLIYKNASAIVPLSSDMKMSIVGRYPFLNNKLIEVIENISEINRFQNMIDVQKSIITEKIGFKPRFSILYAGTFGKVNGIKYVVDLATETMALDPSIIFILIGKGAEKENIIQLAKAKGLLGKNLFILDPVTKNELPQLYFESQMGSSYVIEIKELWANSANKFFDTLAAGKPILINYKGWQEQVIVQDNVGYVLPVKLDGSSIEKFVKYTQNQEIQSIQQKNALKKANDCYSLEVAVNSYIKVFNYVKKRSEIK